VAGFSAGIIFPRLSPIGVGITAGTIITAYGTGVGGNGTYYVNKSQTVGPIAMTFNDPLGGIIDAFAAGNSGVPKMYVTLNRNVGAGTFELSVDGSTSINGASDASAAGSGVHTVTTRPIKVVPHPCPCVTVTGSGGHVNVVDARSAPTQGRPFRSYGARSFTGQMHAIASNLTSPMLVWGNLKKMTIDVIKADTTTGGGARTMILGETQATFTGTAGTPSTHITATVVTGYISPGDTVIGTGITAGTKVVSQVSGPPGGAGEYILSAANTTSAASVTAYGCNGFDANQLPLDFSGSIDLLNVGSRVITNLTGTTTSVMIGADSFAFYTGWLSDSVRPSFPDLVGGQPISSYAQLAITVETDQGIFTTPYPVYARTSAWPNIALEVDTIVPAVGTDIGV
jgi:hypothetical protein